MKFFKTKKDIEQYYRQQISTQKSWALAALERIWENQTTAERKAHVTSVSNGVGFTSFDANFLSSLHASYHNYNGLSDKQYSCLFRLMPKYCHQLMQYSFTVGKLQKVKGGYILNSSN